MCTHRHTHIKTISAPLVDVYIRIVELAKDSTTRWVLVSRTMNGKIQMVTVAFIVIESHSNYLNIAVHMFQGTKIHYMVPP